MLKLKTIFTLVILSLTLTVSQGMAQTQSSDINPSQVDVSKLSDAQVRKIMKEIQDRGLTQEQAVALAKARGASQAQIDQLMARIQQLQNGTGLEQPVKEDTSTETPTAQTDSLSVKAPILPTPENEKVFGFKLFNSKNLTFEPSVNIPTPKDYVLGIGDELVITVWGASQATYQLTIDQNGAINIPDIGPVYVAGSTFEEANKQIQKRLISIYSGLSGANPNTYAEVSMGTVRSIKVNVIGDVNAPGTYTLPATASAFNALYLSGGPTENGSFRNIQVIRGGKVVHTIDVYDFLVNANPKANVQLRDQDILFVPTYEERIDVEGAFKRDGLFEVKKGETLANLIKYAGGFAENAYTQNISVTRNTEKEKSIQDVDHAQFSKFTMQNGDMVKADTLLDRYTNRVTINGAVFRPGSYQWKEGMKLSDLLKKADGPKEEAFLNRAILSRRKANWEWENIAFNLGDVEKGTWDTDLRPNDVVTIRSIFDMREDQTVNIVGEVLNPGKFPYNDKMTLEDLIFRAGGFKENADVGFIEVARRLSHSEASETTNQLSHIFTFQVPRNLKLNPKDAGFVLEPFDQVYVRRAPGYRDQGSVMVDGEVVYAGSYSIAHKNERISDIINRAGGFTRDAYLKGATLTRSTGLTQEEIDARKTLMEKDSTLKLDITPKQLVGIDLQKIMANPGSDIDLMLMPGDELHIPKKMQTIKVSGGVMNPVAQTFEQGKSLRSYINKAGGFAPRARRGKVYVIYPNGTTATTHSFLFLARNYPKITPGSEIIVPARPDKEGMSAAQWISLSSALSAMSLTIVTLVNKL
ncbi:SLBB domain-containing protein [Prolixibacter sp. NT017]|uniref:SLBB domain-containing protein n=1 Tax=Prolixibacter sp. NT017 TaxID=2652390 RepID=UPI001288041F|nr:SLBB domain-containing protein [Prolixibacter sp. NT017]GET24209.1 capsule polysaccharide transporter [Prolixibacter sp. NT017]